MKTSKLRKKFRKKKKLNEITEFQKQQEENLAKKIELEAKIRNLIAFFNVKTNLNYNDLEEIKKMINAIKDFIDLSQIERAIKEAFKIFDLNKAGEIELRYLKDCMYALGSCFTENEFRNFLAILTPELKESSSRVMKRITTNKTDLNKIVKFEDFLVFMTALIICDLYRLKPIEVINNAFQTLVFHLDNNLSEWIELENALILSGEKFNEEEIQAMKAYLSIDKNKKTFRYSDYIKLLLDEDKQLKDVKLKAIGKYDEEVEIVESFFV